MSKSLLSGQTEQGRYKIKLGKFQKLSWFRPGLYSLRCKNIYNLRTEKCHRTFNYHIKRGEVWSTAQEAGSPRGM